MQDILVVRAGFDLDILVITQRFSNAGYSSEEGGF
jgi:hypothetical protein